MQKNLFLFIRNGKSDRNDVFTSRCSYDDKLVHARSASVMRGALTGLGIGSTWLFIFASYGLAFWYGVKLVMDDREDCADRAAEFLESGGEDGSLCDEDDINYDSSKLLNVFFSVLMGAMQVGIFFAYFLKNQHIGSEKNSVL